MIDYSIELGTSSDLLAYHYRTKQSGGRLFSLNLVVDSPIYPRVIGTILVTNGMIQARYRQGLREVSGESLSDIRSKTARIARIVIHPELRGLGLATKLVDAAENHLRKHYPKYKYFEIAAQMLTIKPFVHWSYVGNTTSLADRRDKYLSAFKYKLKSARYDNFTNELIETYGTKEAAVEFVNNYDQSNVDHTYAVKDVVSLPMPVYLIGLDEEHDEYVGMIAKEYPQPMYVPEKEHWQFNVDIPELNAFIRTEESDKVKTVHTMFGTREGQQKKILDSGVIPLTSGDILCIMGSSGSGKTTLLKVLCDYDVEELSYYIDEDKAVIDNFTSIEEAYYYLSAMGLSESYLYVTKVCDLSSGQRYRFELAHALWMCNGVLGVDEFGSSLDVLSSLAVFKGLQRITKETGKCVVLSVNDEKKVGVSRRIKMGYWGSWEEI
jgi:ABC-type ATPase with predicted acetyltransferase domain